MSILRPGDIVTCHGRTGHFVLWDTSSRAKYTAVQHNGKYPTSHSAGPQAWTLYHRPVIEVGDFLTHNGRSAEVLSIKGDFIRCGWQQRRRVEGAEIYLEQPVESDVARCSLVLDNLHQFLRQAEQSTSPSSAVT